LLVSTGAGGLGWFGDVVSPLAAAPHLPDHDRRPSDHVPVHETVRDAHEDVCKQSRANLADALMSPIFGPLTSK